MHERGFMMFLVLGNVTATWWWAAKFNIFSGFLSLDFKLEKWLRLIIRVIFTHMLHCHSTQNSKMLWRIYFSLSMHIRGSHVLNLIPVLQHESPSTIPPSRPWFVSDYHVVNYCVLIWASSVLHRLTTRSTGIVMAVITTQTGFSLMLKLYVSTCMFLKDNCYQCQAFQCVDPWETDVVFAPIPRPNSNFNGGSIPIYRPFLAKLRAKLALSWAKPLALSVCLSVCLSEP